MPRTSDVWKHFTRLTDDNGNIIGQARCNSCPKVLETKGGTSNMWRHLNNFHNRKSGDLGTPRPLPPCAPSGSGSGASSSKDSNPGGLQEEANQELAQMIALSGSDPAIVEDIYFKSFASRLNPEFKLPKRLAIEEMCDSIFSEETCFYSRYDGGKFSLAVGKAKVMEREVIYTACHSIDDEWNLHWMIDEAYVLVPPRGGSHGPILGAREVSLKDAVPRIISDIFSMNIDIEENLFMLLCAITDDHIDQKLEDGIEKERPFGCRRKLICAAPVDHVRHSIARCLLPDPDFIKDKFYSMLDFLRLTRHGRQELLLELDLDDPWEYDEPWYSCYCSLQVVAKRAQSQSGYYLDLLKQVLCMAWGQIYRAIKRISASSGPTSNLCLEELFRVRDVLQSQLSENSAAHVAGTNSSGFGNKNAADVLREALATVDKAILDSYLVWSIPRVLDPRYKLSNPDFRMVLFGSEVAASVDYTTEVTRKMKELFRKKKNYQKEEELYNYLNTCVIIPATEGFDVLKWWEADGSKQYPCVAEMARDALAMPTCSKLTPVQTAHVRSVLRGYDNFYDDSYSDIED